MHINQDAATAQRQMENWIDLYIIHNLFLLIILDSVNLLQDESLAKKKKYRSFKPDMGFSVISDECWKLSITVHREFGLEARRPTADMIFSWGHQRARNVATSISRLWSAASWCLRRSRPSRLPSPCDPSCSQWSASIASQGRSAETPGQPCLQKLVPNYSWENLCTCWEVPNY